jgi:16S rRNA (guanine527-N7)-methyltransferase
VVDEHVKLGSEVRGLLESYRADPQFSAVLTEAFLRRMETFAATLSLWGARMNLTSRPGDPNETVFHLVDSLMAAVLVPDAFVAGNRILDLGSGAGFPGLILSSACDAYFTLAEARQKRASFLRVAAAEMALDNIDFLTTRLSATAITPKFDAVLSRASGPASEFHAIASRALVPAGLAILYSTPSQRLDSAAAKAAGLGAYHRYKYTVRRGPARVEHALATWRLLKKPN